MITDSFGYHLCALNDVDGDGCADLALDDGDGSAWVVSGKDGRVLAHASGLPIEMTTLGGDVDGDGAWDIAMWNGSTIYGQRRDVDPTLYSGKDLHEIRRCIRPDGWAGVDGVVRAAGDWNGDAKPDIALAAGALLIFSGATGEVLLQVDPDQDLGSRTRITISDVNHDSHPDILQGGMSANWWLMPERARLIVQRPEVAPPKVRFSSVWRGSGAALGVVPDIDGDGWDEPLFGRVQRRHLKALGMAPPQSRDVTDHYYKGVVAFSGRTGEPLRALPFEVYGDPEHISSALVDDLDNDTVPELAVAYDIWLAGTVVVHSGKTGAVLRTHKEVAWKGPDANVGRNGRFAVSVFALGDTDADGVKDYAIGAGGTIYSLDVGCFSIYSGKTGTLRRVIWKRDLVKK